MVEQLADHDRAFDAGVLGDLPDRSLQGAADDIDAGFLVFVVALGLDGLGSPEQRHAAAGNDAFLDRSAGRIQRVVDAVLLVLHLDLGRAADLDHRNTAGELGKPLLQLLLVIIGRRVFDLLLDLADAGLDVRLLAGAVDDRGVVLADGNALGLAEHVDRRRSRA